MTVLFKDVDHFYATRGGARSGEMDLGVWWSESTARWPRFRVTVVHDTGDVYAFNQTSQMVEYLATIAHGCHMGAMLRHSDRSQCPYALIDSKLDGWIERCGELGSLVWVRAKLTGWI